MKQITGIIITISMIVSMLAFTASCDLLFVVKMKKQQFFLQLFPAVFITCSSRRTGASG